MVTEYGKECRLCPRRCGVDRVTEFGVCGCGTNAVVAHVMLHKWEEPCISGTIGSGAVFFSGCQLKCVYCQNKDISRSSVGRKVTDGELADIFLKLQSDGAHNINLVSPDHFVPSIINAVSEAKSRGLSLPIIYNCSGYVTAETLKALENTVDVYLTDFKYLDENAALRYSMAKDYPSIVKEALAEMMRQKGEAVYENGLIKRGVIVRHLVLPGLTGDSENITAYLHNTYGDKLTVSIMRQFTPVDLESYPEINRKITTLEYDRVVNYALSIGMTNAYTQEKGTADESFIPPFAK